MRGVRRIARQIADQAIAQRQAVLREARRLHLDFHARHVDAGRAFALAGLARHAQFHGLGHVVAGQRVGAELAGQREAQRVGAAARDMRFVARHAIARAHGAALGFAAGAVVVAHLDGRLQPAAGARIVGPVEPRRHGCRAIVAGRSAARRDHRTSARARSCRD